MNTNDYKQQAARGAPGLSARRRFAECHLKPAAWCCSGFTLIELVTVMVLIGILAAFGGLLLMVPIDSFTDQSRRAALTDEADNALQRISRELHQALPNSVRIAGGGTALEFLNTATGGRYRARPDATGSEILEDCVNDDFEVLGGISAAISFGASDCRTSAVDCLVVYNTGTDFNAYAGDNIANITGVDLTNNLITCDGNGTWTEFPFPIPPSGHQRFFVVDMPISYVCDTGQLLRYANYDIDSTLKTTALDFGVTPSLVANNVSSCSFSYNPADASSRYGLVTLEITILDPPTNERVVLMYQTHVANIP